MKIKVEPTQIIMARSIEKKPTHEKIKVKPVAIIMAKSIEEKPIQMIRVKPVQIRSIEEKPTYINQAQITPAKL